LVRAFLKAPDICRPQPAPAARPVVGCGITEQDDYALESLTEARYDRWRDFDPENVLRCYALRMQEVGFTGEESANASVPYFHHLWPHPLEDFVCLSVSPRCALPADEEFRGGGLGVLRSRQLDVRTEPACLGIGRSL
jgi:hypothetical protein